MDRCDHCDKAILFGGVRENGVRYCGDECYTEALLHSAAGVITPEMIEARALEIHQSECPRCYGPGPVDVHTAHSIWSVVYLTSWKSTPHLVCRSCGFGRQFQGLMFSTLFGWWGFWGLLVTPVQVFRNIRGLASGPDPSMPSEELKEIAHTLLASELAAGRHGAVAVEEDDESIAGGG